MLWAYELLFSVQSQWNACKDSEYPKSTISSPIVGTLSKAQSWVWKITQKNFLKFQKLHEFLGKDQKSRLLPFFPPSFLPSSPHILVLASSLKTMHTAQRNISSCVYLTTAEFHWDAALIFPREQRVRRVVGAVGIYLGAVMLHCSEGASTGCAKRENMNMRCLHSTLSSPPWPELPLSFPSQWATTPELESAFPI